MLGQWHGQSALLGGGGCMVAGRVSGKSDNKRSSVFSPLVG